MAFIIVNTEGKTGRVWSDEYEIKEDAGQAVRDAMGWGGLAWSSDFMTTHKGQFVTAWCVYPDAESCDSDETGAYAVRVIKVT